MSSGGGIARFASRTAVSSTGDAAAPPSENSATKFSFSFNDNSDALSATSDDEFGFLGGGGSSVGGDDFFMMNDGGFNHERDTFDDSNGGTSMSTTENTAVQNGGIALFRGRTVTVPSNNSTMATKQQGTADDEMEPVSNTLPNFPKSAMQASNCSDATLLHGNNAGISTGMVIAPKSTPDGRVLPMPLHRSVVTPHTTTAMTLTEQYECSKDGFPLTPSDRYNESPNGGYASTTMGPPPNRHFATAITPASDHIVANRISTQANGTTATKLFVNETNSDVTSGIKQPFITDESVIGANGQIGNSGDDTNARGNAGNSEDFHQHHQQFITMIRDLHDTEKKLQDMMLDGSLQIDVATALLLQMKCSMYNVTDQILEQFDLANVALREFLPQSLEQE